MLMSPNWSFQKRSFHVTLHLRWSCIRAKVDQIGYDRSGRERDKVVGGAIRGGAYAYWFAVVQFVVGLKRGRVIEWEGGGGSWEHTAFPSESAIQKYRQTCKNSFSST